MKITINFDDTYLPVQIQNDLSKMTFSSPQIDGSEALIVVIIERLDNPYMPNVYNLGFGPLDGNGGFLDNIRLKHVDIDKLFSTVLFHGLNFLQINPQLTMGVDGSDDLRATTYHLMFKTNRDYLDEFFFPIGVDWYVRIFRDGHYEADEHGNYIAKPRPEPFDFDRSRHDLYRYYMFQLT
jgi:hypothetical protein